MAQKDYNCMIKIVVVGAINIGKTSLLMKYVNDEFEETDTLAPIQIVGDSKEKIVDAEGMRVKVAVWDTAGQEKFRAVTSSYYRKADGVLICFALDDEKSFSDVDNWVGEILKYGESNVDKRLVGLRNDLGRQVQTSSAEKKASELGCSYVETSAKTGEGVDSAFDVLVKTVVKRRFQSSRPSGGAGAVAPVAVVVDSGGKKGGGGGCVLL